MRTRRKSAASPLTRLCLLWMDWPNFRKKPQLASNTSIPSDLAATSWLASPTPRPGFTWTGSGCSQRRKPRLRCLLKSSFRSWNFVKKQARDSVGCVPGLCWSLWSRRMGLRRILSCQTSPVELPLSSSLQSQGPTTQTSPCTSDIPAPAGMA